MTYTLTFVAANNDLKIEQLNEIYQGQYEWRVPNKVAQTNIDSALSIDKIKQHRKTLAPRKIDVFCTPSNFNAKLFLADMDATIVTTETLDELAAEAGIKDQIAAITQRRECKESSISTPPLKNVSGC